MESERESPNISASILSTNDWKHLNELSYGEYEWLHDTIKIIIAELQSSGNAILASDIRITKKLKDTMNGVLKRNGYEFREEPARTVGSKTLAPARYRIYRVTQKKN